MYGVREAALNLFAVLCAYVIIDPYDLLYNNMSCFLPFPSFKPNTAPPTGRYILMLATMTYSIELFTCTLLGLSVGYFISLKYKNLSSPPKATNTNPCCDFLEDELSLNDATDYERISDGNEPADTFGSSVGLEKRRNNVPGSLV